MSMYLPCYDTARYKFSSENPNSFWQNSRRDTCVKNDMIWNYGQDEIKSFIVWYWKSARSVDNFWSKKRTAFESHCCFGSWARLGGPGFKTRWGQIFFFVIMNVFSYEISQNRLNDWIYYNTLVFLLFFLKW